MYDTETGRAIRESLDRLARSPDAFSEADAVLLRQLVYAAVDELRAKGWPIEQIIVRIKEVARESGVRLGNSLRMADHPAVSTAVLWCVERYYGRTKDD